MIEASLTAEQKERLQEYGKGFQTWLDTENGKLNLDDHKKHEKYFKSKLSKEAINDITEEDIIEIFSNMWAHSSWTNKRWISKKVLDKNGLPKLKQEIHNLLYGPEKFVDRFDSITHNMAGVGTSIVTEILNMVHPNDYCLWNAVSKQTLKFLNILLVSEKLFKQQRLTGEEYYQCLHNMNTIKIELKPYGVANFVDLDLFIWYVHENYLPVKSRDEKSHERQENETKLDISTSIWVVRAGKEGKQEREALENNIITVGWNEISDLSLFKTRDELRRQYKKLITDESGHQVSQGVGQIWKFLNGIKIDDLVILPLMSNLTKNIAIGKVMGGYQYSNINENIKHTRKVKWLHKDIPIKEFDPSMKKSLQLPRTVYSIRKKADVNQILDVLKKYGILDYIPHDRNRISESVTNQNELLLTLHDVSKETYFPIRILEEIEALLR